MKLPWRRSRNIALAMPPIPERLDRKAIRQLQIFYAHPVMARCGHLTSLQVIVWHGDEAKVTDMSSQDQPEVCGDCLAAMAICCAWCGKAIFIGDPVTLYRAPREKIAELPEGAVSYLPDYMEGGSRAYITAVGCLGWSCADTGADRAGFWLPDPNRPGHGYVEPVESMYDLAMRDGIAIVEDTSKP
jgi:hypothetical protein